MRQTRFCPLESQGLVGIGYYTNYIIISILLKQSMLGALGILFH